MEFHIQCECVSLITYTFDSKGLKKFNCALHQLNYNYLNSDDELTGGMLLRETRIYVTISFISFVSQWIFKQMWLIPSSREINNLYVRGDVKIT